MSSEVDASPCMFSHRFNSSIVINVGASGSTLLGAMLAAAFSTVLAGFFDSPLEDRQKIRMAEHTARSDAQAERLRGHDRLMETHERVWQNTIAAMLAVALICFALHCVAVQHCFALRYFALLFCFALLCFALCCLGEPFLICFALRCLGEPGGRQLGEPAGAGNIARFFKF